MALSFGQRGQVDVGHIGPLVAQQPGHGEVGVQSAHAAVNQFSVLLRCVGMAKPVEGQGPVGARVPHLVPVFHDEELQQVDGPIRVHIAGHQQLMASGRAIQLFPHGDGNLLVDGHRPYLATLALDGDAVFPERPLRRGGVDAEALVDAQADVPAQIEGQNEVIAVLSQRLTKHLVELHVAPGAVHAAETAPLQFHGQFVIGGQLVLGPAHFVVEEPDGGQIGLDGGGGLAALLHPEGIAGQVLAADVLQLLKMEFVRQVGTEPLERLVVALLGAETALAVVAGQLVQLAHQSQVEA